MDSCVIFLATLILVLSISCIPFMFACICCKMAEKRGKDKTIGALAGIYFGIFAIAYYYFAKD